MYNCSIFASTLLAAVAVAAPEADRVAKLPGQPAFDTFPVYSGYLPIGATSKSLHYMFIESENDPANDPVLIWFNGGPGCSSLLGWIQEHGPYVIPNGESEFIKNEWNWNKEVNLLYIESPGGVGFSTCVGVEDCTQSDDKSAEDNLTALLSFYEKFPEFLHNDLFISGESYAGIYVPYLAN